MRTLLILILAGVAGGCATMKKLIGPTLPYTATLCATGSVPLKCVNLGKIDVPESGTAFVQLILGLAGPQLTKQAKLKDCLFTTHEPEVRPEQIRIWASAVCTLQGQAVQEEVSLTLVPVPPEPAA